MSITRRGVIGVGLASVLGTFAGSASAIEPKNSTVNMPFRPYGKHIDDPEKQWEIIKDCEWAIYCTADDAGVPYGVPVSTAVVDGKIIFHGAGGDKLGPRGRKWKNSSINPNVCLTYVRPNLNCKNELNIDAESVIVTGTVRIVTDEQEKYKLMKVLLAPHNPKATKADIDKKLEVSGKRVKEEITFYVVTPTLITGKLIKHFKIVA